MLKRIVPVLLILSHGALQAANTPAADTLTVTKVTPANDQSTANEADAAPGWIKNSFYWLERERDVLANQVTSTATGLDQYISRDSFKSNVINHSYVKLRFNHSFSTGFDEQTSASIKARIDVPNSKDKLQIFFDSEPDDYEGISNRRRETTGNDLKNKSDNAVFGIAILDNSLKNWRPNLSLGIRLKLPLDPYLKASLKRNDKISELWRSRLDLSGSHYDSKGWRAGAEYDFYRPINKLDIFRISNEAEFIDQENTWEFYHSYSYYHKLRSSSLEYSFSVSAASQPNPQISAYWTRVTWRKPLYEDWLFGKIVPEISFPRSRDFADTYSIFFELEIFIGENYIP
ncbi:MAG: hypothetical protein WCY88_08410 [Spongiibacteraceae bacterium]